MKPGDLVKLRENYCGKHGWITGLCYDPDCYHPLKPSGVTSKDLGVVIQVHWHTNQFRSYRVVLPNGITGWIDSRYLEVIR